MSNATRAVEAAPRMAVDRPQRFGFRAAVNAISVAALVNLIALAASAVGAPGLLSNDTPVATPSIFAPTSTPAFAIRDLSYFVLGICAVIFIVVGVGPGAVATPINLSTMQDPVLMKKLDDAIPLGRMAKPEEIASVVAFLAGDGGSYMTATTVFADGGIMRGSPGL